MPSYLPRMVFTYCTISAAFYCVLKVYGSVLPLVLLITEPLSSGSFQVNPGHLLNINANNTVVSINPNTIQNIRSSCCYPLATPLGDRDT